MDYLPDLKFNLNNITLLSILSLICMSIGFFLVLYPLTTLLLLIVALIITFKKYKTDKEKKNIKLAKPHIQEFIDNYFKVHPIKINKNHNFPKSINIVQNKLKENNINIQNQNLLNLILNELLVRFVETNLDCNFRSKKDKLSKVKLKGFMFVLAQLKINISEKNVANLINKIQSYKKEEDFEDYFFTKNPQLSSKPSLKEWVQAYVDTFENNKEYISYLEEIIKYQGITLAKKELEIEIEKEIEKRIIQRNAQDIYQAMTSTIKNRRKFNQPIIEELN